VAIPEEPTVLKVLTIIITCG